MWANASLDPICFMENERGQVVGTKLAGEPRQIYVLDALLSKQEWLLGKDFSVADVAVPPPPPPTYTPTHTLHLPAQHRRRA